MSKQRRGCPLRILACGVARPAFWLVKIFRFHPCPMRSGLCFTVRVFAADRCLGQDCFPEVLGSALFCSEAGFGVRSALSWTLPSSLRLRILPRSISSGLSRHLSGESLQGDSVRL